MIKMTTMRMREEIDIGDEESMPNSMQMVKKIVIMKGKMNSVT